PETSPSPWPRRTPRIRLLRSRAPPSAANLRGPRRGVGRSARVRGCDRARDRQVSMPPGRRCPHAMSHRRSRPRKSRASSTTSARSEEHTSELQSRFDLVCRLLLEKKKYKTAINFYSILPHSL